MAFKFSLVTYLDQSGKLREWPLSLKHRITLNELISNQVTSNEETSNKERSNELPFNELSLKHRIASND